MSSVQNRVVAAVMDIIDGLNNFAPIRRGALGTGPGLTCEVAPSTVESVFMDKNSYVILDLTLNGKHSNLETLSATLNNIVENLTRRREYPAGDGFQIVDIAHGAPPYPTTIGREDNGEWIMAASVFVKYYRRDEQE